MLIRIEYHNGNFDMVKPGMLNRLLADEQVSKFWRDTGWVHIDHEPRCSNLPLSHFGADRRNLDA